MAPRKEVNKKRERRGLGGSQAEGKKRKGQKGTRWLPDLELSCVVLC